MDFVRSHFGKNATLNSRKKGACIVLQVPFCEEKSVRLFWDAFFLSQI